MKWNLIFTCFISFLLFAGMGCQSDKKREAGNQAKGPEVKALPSGEITYTMPEGWIKLPPISAMRKDQFSFPGVEGAEEAELAVFFFPGSGGTVEANLNRWYGQFKRPDGSPVEGHIESKKLNVHGIPVTIVYVTGTYLKSASPMMMSGPVDELPEYALMAAIAETSNGPWFFKATGPQKTIDHWRPSFEKFVRSFDVKK